MYQYLPGLEFFSAFLEIYLCYRILNLLFVNQYKNTRREIWFQEGLMVGYSVLLAAFVRWNNQVLMFSDLLVFEVILVVFLTCVWFFEVNKAAVLAVTAFYFMCLSFADVLGIVLMSKVLEDTRFAVQLGGGTWFRVVFILCVDSAWLILYLLLVFFRKNKCKNGVAEYRYGILAASAIGYGAIYYFQKAAFLNLTDALAATWIIFLMLFFMFLAAVWIYKRYRDTKEENRLIEVQKYYLENNMADMQQLYDSSSRNYHDIKNHLNAIYQMVKEDKKEEVLRYIEQIGEPFRKLDRKVWTGNQMTDMIINCNEVECEKYGIKFEVYADIIPHMSIENQDLCTILSNLMDNAIEACRKNAKEDKKICLKVRQRNSMLFIDIKNIMREEPLLQNGRIVTRKKDRSIHGLGIENIRRAVEKYDGYCKYIYEDHYFETMIILPLELECI